MSTSPHTIAPALLAATLALATTPSAPAFIAIDGDFGDWNGMATPPSVDDPADMADTSGDIRRIEASVEGENLVLRMTAEGTIAPSLDETPEGMTNRYYYHWIIDSDDNPATGFNSSEYEGNPTGLERPIGVDVVIQVAWRNGVAEDGGTYAYDPLTQTGLIADFPVERSEDGRTLTATIPYAALGLTAGQTISFSAFQEGESNGWQVDWIESAQLLVPPPAPAPPSVDDPADMADTSGDIRRIEASVEGENLVLRMTADGTIAPSLDETPEGMTNRYYYHWIIDSDDNPATGFNNSEYEGSPTGLERPIGVDVVIQVAWRNGVAEDGGTYAYDPLTQTGLIADFPVERSEDGRTLTATIPYAALGLTTGQTIAFSAFQEGQSNGWQIDWVESAQLTVQPASAGSGIVSIEDPTDDLADPSGDIRLVQAATDGTYLFLRMAVEEIFGPTTEETPPGMNNRYYYHWILDTDNNPATGFANSEYEGNPTGLEHPIGADTVIQLGWRNGVAEDGGVYAYNPLTRERLAENYEFAKNGDSVEARVLLADLGLATGQTIAFSAFQEGQSNGWQVDWIESATLTLVPPGNLPDLVADFSADPFGFRVRLEDAGGDEVDTGTVRFAIDGTPVGATVEKDDGTTTATGVFDPWLTGGAKHTLTVTYRTTGSEIDRVRAIPFDAPAYAILNPDDAAAAPDPSAPGFLAGVTQISSLQAFTPSQHGNQSDRAERQLAGELRDPFGERFYNEASTFDDRWVVPVIEVPETINWHEFAPEDTGHFNGSNDRPDEAIPGLGFTAEGTVIEIRTYLELDAGFHTLAVNTTGGFKFTTGPDGRDKLVPVVDEFNGSRGYSYEGDHYFSLLAPAAGIYPVRLLWFHSTRTYEHAQLEFYSVEGKRKVLVNDPDDPDAIRAYRRATGTAPYVREVSPAPGFAYATPETPVQMLIAGPVRQGSVAVTFDGTPVAAEVDFDDDFTTVTYQPTGLAWGGVHEVGLAYATESDPQVMRDASFTYALYESAPILPAEWATAPGTGRSPGFAVRSVQSQGARANTVAAAEAQLAGGAGHAGTDGPATIDYSLFAGGFTGLFGPDNGLHDADLIHPSWPTNYATVEILVYLDLPAGAHTLGVNSDDGFLLTAGPEAVAREMELGRFEGGRGIAPTPQNLFDVIIETPGVYGFRLLWFQGEGEAGAEWYAFDRETEVATLLNAAGPGTIRAYQSRIVGSAPTISIRREGADIILEWTGTLEESGSTESGWETVDGAESPLIFTPGPGARRSYFRSR